MTAETTFALLVVAVAAQRLWELRRSARHQAIIIARGGREHAPAQLHWMRAIHAAWLAGMLVEAWAVRRAVPPIAVGLALVAFLAGQALRLLAMRELGERWTVSIVTQPGVPAVASGIFRYIRHPNYAGVCIELVALPTLGGAYVTALLASVANGVLLYFRIRAEEAALSADSHYDWRLPRVPRFFPVRLP